MWYGCYTTWVIKHTLNPYTLYLPTQMQVSTKFYMSRVRLTQKWIVLPFLLSNTQHTYYLVHLAYVTCLSWNNIHNFNFFFSSKTFLETLLSNIRDDEAAKRPPKESSRIPPPLSRWSLAGWCWCDVDVSNDFHSDPQLQTVRSGLPTSPSHFPRPFLLLPASWRDSLTFWRQQHGGLCAQISYFFLHASRENQNWLTVEDKAGMLKPQQLNANCELWQSAHKKWVKNDPIFRQSDSTLL